MACCEEPHWRSMVVAGTDSGQPAASTALRPMLRDCSETCMTQPMITSSIRAGSSWLRSASALRASEARSTARQLRSFPLRFPPGVRTASTITAVVMVCIPLYRVYRANGSFGLGPPPSTCGNCRGVLLEDAKRLDQTGTRERQLGEPEPRGTRMGSAHAGGVYEKCTGGASMCTSPRGLGAS